MLTKKAFLGGAFLVAGCRSATQVTVELVTDVACETKPSTAARVGTLGSDIEARPVSVATTACGEGGRIGSFVVIPSGSSRDAFAVKVVLARGRTVESCGAAETTSGDFAGCIVARRALRFIPHTELTLPIVLRQNCDGIICDVRQTCVRGACVDAVVPDPGSCAGAGCPDSVLGAPDAGLRDAGVDDSSNPPVDAVVDARREASADPCGDASCPVPPSCDALPSCGTTSDSCCASPLVPGGTFFIQNMTDFPRTISPVRLDRYEVTVGRFRAFVSAVLGGWLPATGSGKHAHLANGGLRNLFDQQIEKGWDPAWNGFLPTSKTLWDDVDHLSCGGGTWTQNAGANEKKPIGCITWHQAYAFCIWDGGFLPSLTERNYAASGGDKQRPYPWGPEPPDSNRAQYCPMSGNTFCSVSNRPPFADVGSKPAGDGLFGQADLAGNVWEWLVDSEVRTDICKDCYFFNPASQQCLGPGGGVDTPASFLLTSLPFEPDPMTSRLSEVGFRCARSP